jgi:hypothetical protein
MLIDEAGGGVICGPGAPGFARLGGAGRNHADAVQRPAVVAPPAFGEAGPSSPLLGRLCSAERFAKQTASEGFAE